MINSTSLAKKLLCATILTFAASAEASLYLSLGVGAFIANGPKQERLSSYNSHASSSLKQESTNLAVANSRGLSLYPAIGYNFFDLLRIEVGYASIISTNKSIASNKRNLASYSLKTNKIQTIYSKVYIDLLPIAFCGSPYLSAGVGISRINSSAFLPDDRLSFLGFRERKLSTSYKDKQLSWSAGLGVNILKLPILKLDVGYEFENFGKLPVSIKSGKNLAYGKLNKALTNHSIMLKLRFEI